MNPELIAVALRAIADEIEASRAGSAASGDTPTDPAIVKIRKAMALVSEIARDPKAWRMSIPARPEHDADLVLMDALYCAEKELERLYARPVASAQAGATNADDLPGMSARSDGMDARGWKPAHASPGSAPPPLAYDDKQYRAAFAVMNASKRVGMVDSLDPVCAEIARVAPLFSPPPVVASVTRETVARAIFGAWRRFTGSTRTDREKDWSDAECEGGRQACYAEADAVLSLLAHQPRSAPKDAP